MDQEPQVFSSNITRSSKALKNDLTDLLKVVPAQPVVEKKYETRKACDFLPKIGKTYVPKRKSKLKVSTVRDIRHLYEKDVYSTLLVDLEKQQNVLLRKIKAGSGKDENTKTLTKNMFKCDKPVSRSAWQMLTNLNPEEYAHSTQFVLWNGKRIRVNGSKGGPCKFLCKYDLGTRLLPKKAKSSSNSKFALKRKGLLQNSLSVNFKPGPLRKKIFLDNSYQKYHVGGIELQKLPRPALEIYPTVGKTIDPTISHFIHNMQQGDGTITEKWAEFSVSILATVKNETVTQIEEECSVTFDLNYKCDQQKILMRRDVNSEHTPKPLTNVISDSHCEPPKDTVLISEIQSLLDRMIDSVEISLDQDNMFTGEDEPRDVVKKEENANVASVQSRETRLKRKCGELERLDVTIIRLSESIDKKPAKTCPKAFCTMGCICPSLECGYNFKTHCGRIECMFECKCDFSKFKVIDSFERDCSDLLPGLLKLDNEMSSKMAKEEQKFHHTVIVTPENSMLLKSKRRDWKSSKKYSEFYRTMSLKNETKPEKSVALVIEKLNIPNVEPWCMVHSLYKCFCKGLFTDNSMPEVKTDDSKDNNCIQEQTKSIDLTDDTETANKQLKMRMSNRNTSEKIHIKDQTDELLSTAPYDPRDLYDYSSRSARVKSYKGRKFSDGYYFNANRKISEMEQHDSSLRKRLVHLYNASTSTNIEKTKPSSSNVVPSIQTSSPQNTAPCTPSTPTLPPLPPLTSAPTIKPTNPSNKPTNPSNKPLNTKINLFTNRLPDKAKLVSWLEVSYKQYKQRINRGITKIALEPPHLGKMALYPWQFILGRYRDRKNLFLITTKLPYRIFMAVDPQHPFFRQCININDIRFADLPKYPVTVKNLLANADDVKDNFCILWGLSHCWELIGSVTKVGNPEDINETIQVSNENDGERRDSETYNDAAHVDSEDSNATNISLGQYQEEDSMTSEKTIDNDNDTSSDDSSRWFVMTIENDFDEIQFYNKGFFVKLDSILKAINVARASKKTVRLSSQKCVDNSTGPQFGIYAIPNETESCVFVGPYEKDESLGIETIKKISDIRKQKRTRGVWITTKKLENFDVIDNPLSFMPQKNASDTTMMTLTGDSEGSSKDTDRFVEVSKGENEVIRPNSEKQDSRGSGYPKLKPIKICKTNSFYQLGPNGTLTQISPERCNEQSQISIVQPKVLNKNVCVATTIQPKVIKARVHVPSTNEPKVINGQLCVPKPTLINKSLLKPSEPTLAPLFGNPILNKIPKPTICHIQRKFIKIKKPVAEIAPQVKQSTPIKAVIPSSGDEPAKKEKGMFILKPEEINKRHMQAQGSSNSENLNLSQSGSESGVDPELEMDIENFLATAEECEAPNDDVLIISDDEMDNTHTERKLWEDVWIECTTIDGLGWIRARKNNEDLVSFEFPGFKYTEFYTQEQAFAKLSQVLSRKIYIPKSINLEWHIVESEQDLRAKHMLTQEELAPDFVMTKRGIRHKQELVSRSSKKDDSDENTAKKVKTENAASSIDNEEELLDNVSQESDYLALEEEGEELLKTFKSSATHAVIGRGLKDLDGMREEIAARLQSMVSDT